MSEKTHKSEPNETHLEKLTIKELREIAAGIPHERAIHDMKKEELIAFIREARGIKDDVPVKKKKNPARGEMTRPELKARIRELKALRMRALEAGEKDHASILRRRISHLKKQLRRGAAAA